MAALDIVRDLSFRQLDEWVTLHIASDKRVKAKVVTYLDLPYWTAASVGFVITEPEAYRDVTTSGWRDWYFEWKGLTYYWFQVSRLPGKQLLFVEGRSPSLSTIQNDLSGLPAYIDDDAAVAAGLEIGMPYWVLPGNDGGTQDTIKRVSNVSGYPDPFTTVPFGLGLLNSYDSDASAIADGLAIGDAYWAATGHEIYPQDALCRVSA
jgi:hypothetical protein